MHTFSVAKRYHRVSSKIRACIHILVTFIALSTLTACWSSHSSSPVTHTISGTITGLTTSGLVLRNNGSDDLNIAANATTFQFTTPVAVGGGYSVTAFAQPTGLTCTISNGAGSNVSSDITNVHIACSEIAFSVGGTITGLAGSGLVLQNNGSDDLSVVSSATTFEFATRVAYGGGYAVTVLTQPAGQYCSIAHATGTSITAQVTNVTVSCGQATLTPSVAAVALSVTGNPRQITITNNGSLAVTNLSIAYPVWPSGTSVSSTTCATSLAPAATCTINITPGSVATAGAGNAACSTGIAPTPGTITVSADNAPTSTIDIVVLNYGCIYQGGYVYAIDDTTPATGSIGGKVVATTDQAAAWPNGIVWSSNGATGQGSGGIDSADVSLDGIPGIEEASTSFSGSPTYFTFVSFFSSTYTNPNPFTGSSFSACNGGSDGHCNTSNISVFYNQFVTNNNGSIPPFTASAGPTPNITYAAGLCRQTISGHADWYLPAICEMGGTGQGAGCTNAANTTIDNLSILTGYYWSSTEHSASPAGVAWVQSFAPGVGSSQISAIKNRQNGVRCSRLITP